MSIRALIDRLIHNEVLKIVAEEQADDVLQPHSPEIRQQNKEAAVKRSKEIIGSDFIIYPSKQST